MPIMSKLYFIPTPIGNLGDITLRSLEILKNAKAILAEKPTKTLKLLSHFEIRKSIYPYFEGKNERYLNKIKQILDEGKDVAFLAEAGSPGIADPGQKLVNWAIENEIEVEFLPGPSSLSLIISASGFNSKNIIFFGFLPKKGRQKLAQMVKNGLQDKRAIVFFFSPYRLTKDLQWLSDLDENLQIVLAKEMTKMHEQFFRGSIQKILKELEKEKIRGEWTGIIRKSRVKNN